LTKRQIDETNIGDKSINLSVGLDNTKIKEKLNDIFDKFKLVKPGMSMYQNKSDSVTEIIKQEKIGIFHVCLQITVNIIIIFLQLNSIFEGRNFKI